MSIHLGLTQFGVKFLPNCLSATLMTGLLLTSSGQVEAGLINAKSVSLADVTSAVSSAHDGDTVVVPAGTASWTSTLNIKKGITLQGAGNDTTVILDDVLRTNANRGGAIIIISLTPSQSFRLTGFTFRHSS